MKGHGTDLLTSGESALSDNGAFHNTEGRMRELAGVELLMGNLSL